MQAIVFEAKTDPGESLLEDPQRNWRLMGRANGFDGTLALRADPVLAGGSR